jgi:predicted HTH transcriptional regulator
MMFDFETDELGYLREPESTELEYKENFHRGDDVLKYIKTLVGMANNTGGRIVFGVKNSPNVPVGMTNTKFEMLDPAYIEELMLKYFTPALKWKMGVVTHEGKRFGVLSVEEAEKKPVMCVRPHHPILREGAIYYRYYGETREINYAELQKLLEQESLLFLLKKQQKVALF